MRQRNKVIALVISTMLLVVSTACHRKAPVVSAPPPPAAPEVVPVPVKPNPPSITEFTAQSSRIERGQSTVLRWQVTDATQVQIDQGLGSVSASGRLTISPSAATTYTLTATGAGGRASASATVDVTAPPPPVQPPAPRIPTLSERLMSEVQDAYFDFDQYNLREDAMAVLTKDAEALKAILRDFQDTTVVIEGHCDERGSAEYNLGLGDRRASGAKEFLVQLGIPGERLIPVSYGKERPECTEAGEACWQRNRRVHFNPGEAQKKVVSQMESLDSSVAPPSLVMK